MHCRALPEGPSRSRGVTLLTRDNSQIVVNDRYRSLVAEAAEDRQRSLHVDARR